MICVGLCQSPIRVLEKLEKMVHKSQFRSVFAVRKGISVFILVFGLAFTAFGALFLYLIVREYLTTLNTHRWPKAPATIQSIEIEYPKTAPRASQHDVFQLLVQFEYSYDDQLFQGNKFRRNPYWSDSYETLADKKWDIVRNEWQHAFVNPEDPTVAILEQDSLWFGMLILLPLLFLLIGLSCIVGSLGLWPRRLRWSGLARPRSRSLPILFGIVFLSIGVPLLAFLCIGPLLQSLSASRWNEVPCTVIWSRVREYDSDDGYTYSPEVFYEYSYDDEVHRSNQYSFDTTSSSGRGGKQRVIDQYPSGAEAKCYVDPNKPWRAVINRRTPMALVFITGIIGGVFSLIGAGILIASTRARH